MSQSWNKALDFSSRKGNSASVMRLMQLRGFTEATIRNVCLDTIGNLWKERQRHYLG